MKHWNRAKLWQKASAGVAVVAASTLTATAC